jgi:hypothetical protein
MAENKPATLSVKLHVDVVESARIVAAYRNETITDLLSSLLRPALADMEAVEVEKRRKGEGKKAGGRDDAPAPGKPKQERYKN